MVETKTEASLWGDRVHKALELRLTDSTPLPEGMTQWESLVKQLEGIPGERHCEKRFAVDEAFQPADWDNCASRGIVDLFILSNSTAIVADYKTGKRKPSDQLELYAAYVFAHYPEVNTVKTAFIWLKEKKIDRGEVARTDAPRIWGDYLTKDRRLTNAYEKDSWPAKPSGLCRGWCPVTQCQFHQPTRKL